MRSGPPPRRPLLGFASARAAEAFQNEEIPTARSDVVEMLNADPSAGRRVRAVDISSGATFMHTGDSVHRRGIAATTCGPARGRFVWLTAN